jgi:hypothetical protein
LKTHVNKTVCCKIPVIADVDVIICGGGPAGCAAAIASARSGARTLLLEKNGYLGGATVAQLVAVVLSTNGVDFQGIWHEYAARLAQHDGFTGLKTAPNPYYPGFSWQRGSVDPEQVKRVWHELVSESGVEVLHYCTVIDLFEENRRVYGVEIFCRGLHRAILGKCIVDATGNGDVAALAGCQWQRGSEPDCYTQEVSMMCRTVGSPEAHNLGNRLEVLSRKNRKQVDTLDIKDLSAATVSMRTEIWREQSHEKLIATADELGVRTSRIVLGRETVTNKAAWNLEKCPHSVARCSWELDVHPTGSGPVDPHLYHGKSAIYAERLQRLASGDWFDIPYGALVSRDIDNLLLAGRIVSAELFAHGALRIQQTCMATGEAAGVVAAVNALNGSVPAEADPAPAIQMLERLRARV